MVSCSFILNSVNDVDLVASLGHLRSPQEHVEVLQELLVLHELLVGDEVMKDW